MTEQDRDERSEERHRDQLVTVDDEKPEGYEAGCLRPLGLCELGGCCDICWYGRQGRREEGS